MECPQCKSPLPSSDVACARCTIVGETLLVPRLPSPGVYAPPKASVAPRHGLITILHVASKWIAIIWTIFWIMLIGNVVVSNFGRFDSMGFGLALGIFPVVWLSVAVPCVAICFATRPK